MPSPAAGYPENIGPFVGRMRRLPDKRAVVLELTPGFRFGLLTGPQAQQFSQTVRGAVVKWFGWQKYDVAGLSPYVQCTSDIARGLVRVDFLDASNVARSGVLAANPEMLLALCESIDHAAAALPAKLL